MRWPPILLAMIVGGCSFSHPIEAVFIEGKLHFKADDQLNGCLNDFRVENGSGEVMWAIRGPFRASPCENNFPLAYGVAPKGFEIQVAAKPLRAGVRYTMHGSDGDRYYGAFSYRQTVVITNAPETARKP